MTEKKRAKAIPPLVTPTNIRKEMVSVYRDMRLKKIESQDGTRFVFVLNAILTAFRDCEVEEKIRELELLINNPTQAESVQPDPTLNKANAPALPCHVKDAT